MVQVARLSEPRRKAFLWRFVLFVELTWTATRRRQQGSGVPAVDRRSASEINNDVVSDDSFFVFGGTNAENLRSHRRLVYRIVQYSYCGHTRHKNQATDETKIQ